MSLRICGDICADDPGGEMPCMHDPGHDGSHRDARGATWARPRHGYAPCGYETLAFTTQDATLRCADDSIYVDPSEEGFYLGDMTHDAAKQLIRFIDQSARLPDPYPQERRDRIRACVVESRRLCGCIQCHGGYDIGAKTLAPNPMAADFAAPASCVAAVLLSAFMRTGAPELLGTEEAERDPALTYE